MQLTRVWSSALKQWSCWTLIQHEPCQLPVFSRAVIFRRQLFKPCECICCLLLCPASISMCPLSIVLSFQTSLLFNGPTTFPILHSFQIASFFPEELNHFTQNSFTRFLHLRLLQRLFWQHLGPMCQYDI